MTDQRKRSPAGTLQRRIFVLLRDRASLTAQGIAAELGAGEESCRKACGYLAARDGRFVVKHTLTRRLVLYAARKGAREPVDRRGVRVECRNHRGAVAWAKWLRMMQRKHGPAWRYLPRGDDLMRMWGM